MQTASNMDIFIECTKKSILSWVVVVTQSYREEAPEDIDLMLKSWLIARKRVLVFMMTFQNSEKPDDVIKVAIKLCTKYDKIMAKVVARNLYVLANLYDEELENASIDLIALNELQLEKILSEEIVQVRDCYKEINQFDELKQKVQEGIEAFGMWIYNAEDNGKPLQVFNTKILMPSDGLGLSFKRCVEYHYFFAQKVVEVS